eukprot:scaffold6067_cov112-Isochrysis_galbana.AAC.27
MRSGLVMYREQTYRSLFGRVSSPRLASHLRTCDHLRTMKMPMPCDLEVGFMIHIEPGLRRNSSASKAWSAGRMKVAGTQSRSSALLVGPPASRCSACTFSSSFRYLWRTAKKVSRAGVGVKAEGPAGRDVRRTRTCEEGTTYAHRLIFLTIRSLRVSS